MCAVADCAAVLTVASKDSEAEEFLEFRLWATQLTPPKTLARPCMGPPSIMVLKAGLHDYLARPLLMLNESRYCMQQGGVIICSFAM